MTEPNKSAQENAPKKVNRKHFSQLLAMKFSEDFDEVFLSFPEIKQLELIDHLLGCIDIMEEYFDSDQDPLIWKKYADKENSFLEKHGSRLRLYNSKKFYEYFNHLIAPIEKGIITIEQYNELPNEEQQLSINEIKSLIYFVRNVLHGERRFFLERQTPKDEQESSKELEGMGRSRKIKRTADDKLTCLSQEQTVLLLYYLQKSNAFLKDEYLTAMEAGRAFEILTGYSQNTVRMGLSKYLHLQNNENARVLNDLFAKLYALLKEDMK